jgi:hypothetical protein
MNLLRRLLLVVTALVPFSWSMAHASFCTTYTGTGKCVNLAGTSTGSVPLSASAVFEAGSGGLLDVTLVNDAGSSAAQLGGSEVITGLFFNLSGAGITGGLTPAGSDASLTVPSGKASNSAVTLGTATLINLPATGNLADGTALETSSFYFAGQYGVVTTGLNGPPGGKGNLGNCAATSSCTVLDGPNWGIIPQTNAGGVDSGQKPLVQYYEYYTLAGLTGLTDALLKLDISNVVVQYGTSTGDGTSLGCPGCLQGNPTPEPTYAFILFGLGALLWYKRRRNSQTVA